TPVAVSGLSGTTAITAESGTNCAVLSGGTVECWGANTYGELGTTTTASNSITPVATSALVLSVAWMSGTTSVATIGPASGLATPVSATSTGSTLITATYGSLNNNTTLTVGLAPTITSGNSATFFEGVAGSVTVTTTGIPTPSLSENGSLPSGVSFTDNHDGTATLAGTPAVGTSASSPYSLTINASNGIGPNASQPFSLTVQVEYAIAVPTTTTLVSSLNPSFTAAPDNSVQFTATVT